MLITFSPPLISLYNSMMILNYGLRTTGDGRWRQRWRESLRILGPLQCQPYADRSRASSPPRTIPPASIMVMTSTQRKLPLPRGLLLLRYSHSLCDLLRHQLVHYIHLFICFFSLHIKSRIIFKPSNPQPPHQRATNTGTQFHHNTTQARRVAN